MSALLDVRGLEAAYGASQVLFGIDLAIGAGEVVTLLGRNGMGKTTTIRAILGLVPARAGTIGFAGDAIAGWPSHRIARAGIGLVPEGRQVFPNLTVAENLVATARPGAWTLERVHALFPRLAERAGNMGNQLSGGEQQMLAIGRGLMGEPRLLILDEPSLGLSPLLVEEMFALVGRLNADGLSVLLVEQNVVQSLAIAHRAYVLEHGAIALSGPAAELARDPALRRSYLGL